MLTRNRPTRRRRKERKSLISSSAQLAAGIIGAAGLVITGQALYVAATTLRLPPPKNSGHDFEQNGLIVEFEASEEASEASEASGASEDCYEEEEQTGKILDHDHYDDDRQKRSFNLALVGDSPVEGIGNDEHHLALGGKTALAFSELLRKPVRYWSYGKSGLTAAGIRKEMVPLLRRSAKKYDIDAVVLSCGVNNVLQGVSPDAFGGEVDELLDSVIECCTPNTKIIMLALIDFAYLPFLPWPLSKACSWRSQALQKEMEAAVKHRQGGRHCIEIASYPNISELISDSSHHLLHHMNEEDKQSLQLSDFYSDDNFHPAGHGSIVAGKIIAGTYKRIMDI